MESQVSDIVKTCSNPHYSAAVLDWELSQKVKEAGVTENLFTVVYTGQAVENNENEPSSNPS